jgi:hypothetical protein
MGIHYLLTLLTFGCLLNGRGDVDVRVEADLPTVNRGETRSPFPFSQGYRRTAPHVTHMLSARDLTPRRRERVRGGQNSILTSYCPQMAVVTMIADHLTVATGRTYAETALGVRINSLYSLHLGWLPGEASQGPIRSNICPLPVPFLLRVPHLPLQRTHTYTYIERGTL